MGLLARYRRALLRRSPDAEISHEDAQGFDITFPGDVTAEIGENNGEIGLGSIDAQVPGTGAGTRALEAIVGAADDTGAWIRLGFDPQLDSERLCAWYRRHGFEGQCSLGEQLVREPKARPRRGSRTKRRRNPQETFELDSTLALVRTDLTGSPSFIILDPYREEYDGGELDEAVVAYLSLENPYVLDGGAFRIYPVSQSVARKGYGPLVYEAAIALVGRDHPAGVMPGTQVSPDARRVWERFGRRRDYHVEELPVEVEGVHGDEVLDAWYGRPRGAEEIPGLARALANGDQFLAGLADRRDEAETFVLEAGSSIFDHLMRTTSSSVPFSRREPT